MKLIQLNMTAIMFVGMGLTFQLLFFIPNSARAEVIEISRLECALFSGRAGYYSHFGASEKHRFLPAGIFLSKGTLTLNVPTAHKSLVMERSEVVSFSHWMGSHSDDQSFFELKFDPVANLWIGDVVLEQDFGFHAVCKD